MNRLLIDGNYMLHRSCRVEQLSHLKDRNGNSTGGILGSLNTIQRELKHHNIQQCVVVFDGGISKRRRDIFPGYKGARARDKSDPFYEAPDEEKQEYTKGFIYQRSFLSTLLRKLGISVVRVPGWEADDIIAKIAKDHAVPGLTIAMSDDNDYLQMVSSWESGGSSYNIAVWRPMKEEMVSTENIEEYLGYEQIEFLLRKSVNGDPGSDKIPGIPGVGPGTIDTSFLGYVGPLDYPFSEYIEHCMKADSKRVRKIAEEFHIIHRNYDLINIELEEYPDEIKEFVNQQIVNTSLNFRDSKEMLVESDLFSIVKEFDSWISPFHRLLKQRSQV